MARYAQKTTGTNKRVNKEGAIAYAMTPEMELYTLVCTSTLKDKFYTKADEDVQRIRKLVRKVNPLLVAKLAVYARTQMYLRTIPLVLAVELAKVHSENIQKGKKLDYPADIVSRMIASVIRRADEIPELLGYYALANGRKGTKQLGKLSKQVQKGLGISFNRFDEYGFGKYNRDTVPSMRDALFLVHPRPKNDEQQALFQKIVDDNLETPYTWEVELSEVGQGKFDSPEEKEAAKRDKWEELIDSGKIGYMALLRNLRNFLDIGVSNDHIDKVAEILSDPERVAKSKQLPFRFYTAYKMLKDNANPNVGIFLDALNTAIWESVKNIDCVDENDTVMIAVDKSSSMTGRLTPSMMYCEVGLLLAVILRKKVKRVTLGFFGSDFVVSQMPKTENVLDAVDRLSKQLGGGATEGWLVPKYVRENPKYGYNKIFMFTDMQLWSVDNKIGLGYGWGYDSKLPGEWTKCKETFDGIQLYLIDLAGYGDSPVDIMSNKSVLMVAGWSDKIFKMIGQLSRGGTVLKELEKIEV